MYPQTPRQKYLARKDNAKHWQLGTLVAYRIVGLETVKILPKEWDRGCVNLDALSERLGRRFPIPDDRVQPDREGYAEWRRESPAILPAGTFVWFDEFKKAVEADFSPERLSIVGEREGDRELVLSAMLAVGQDEMIPPVSEWLSHR